MKNCFFEYGLILVFDCYKTNPLTLVSPTIILHSTLGSGASLVALTYLLNT